MINIKNFDKRKLFKSKIIVIYTILIIILLLVSIVIYIIKDGVGSVSEDVNQEIVIKPTKDFIKTEELWRETLKEKLATENKVIENKITAMQKELQNINDEDKEDVSKIASLEARISYLTEEIHNLQEVHKTNINNEIQEIKNKSISNYVLNLDNAQNTPDYKPIKTIDNYIPAGSFAKAVLLSGVDASTSLMSSADPDPVLIRILDHGTLPRKFKSDLKDCHIIASAFGDLSSERAKMRLEKLSCTESVTGEIIETDVVGFISGEDGRQGVRGEVVSTEGKLINNSLWSGILGGLANNFNPNTAYQPSLVIDNKTIPVSPKTRLQNSFTEGATTSLDRLSKYYIDRAESLQPVIQVGAGRNVDVIFTEGVFFGTSIIKQEIAKKRDEKIRNKSLVQNVD